MGGGVKWLWLGFGGICLWVETLELQGLPLLNSNFTFFKGGSGCAPSRLDRFLIKDVGSRWSDKVAQKVIFTFTSDHFPVVLSSDVESSGSQLFQFFNI